MAVVDLRLGDGTARSSCPDLKAMGTRVLVFTSADDAYSVRAAYAAGASGYVLKSADHAMVLRAVQDVLAGRVHVDPSVAGLLVAGVQAPGRRAAQR